MKYFLTALLSFLFIVAEAQVPPTQGGGMATPGDDMGIRVTEPSQTGNKTAGYYQKDGKYGFVDPQGIKHDAVYNKIDFSSNGFTVQKDGLYGIADKNGQVIGKIAYDSVGTVNDIAYVVKKKGKYGTISTAGDKILSIKYDKILAVTKFVTFVQDADSHIQMIFNDQDKAFATQITRAVIYANLAIIKSNGKFGVVKKQLIVPCTYDSVFVAGTQLYAINPRTKPAVKKYSPIDKSNNFRPATLLTVQNNNKYGLTDSAGVVIYPADNDAVSNQESYRFYTVKKDNLYGIYFLNSRKKTEIDLDRVYADGLGYVMANKNHQSGVFDLQGKQIVPFEYDPTSIAQYRVGFRVEKNKKKGIINKNGEVLVPPVYDDVDPLWESGMSEMVRVKSGDKFGMVNLKGEIIIPVMYTWIGEQKGFLEVVTPDKKFGLYEKTGKVIIPAEYQWIGDSDTQGSNLIVLKHEDNSFNFLNKETKQIVFKENVSGYGYIQDQNGLLSPLSSPYKHLMFVKGKNGKLGMLNEVSGLLDIPMIYDDIIQQSGGGRHSYFTVKNGKKYGLTDEGNKQIIPLQYDAISIDLSTYDDDRKSDPAASVIVAKGKKYGTVNFDNQTLIPFQYADLQRIAPCGLYKAKVGDYYQIINAKNEVISKGPFDEVANFEVVRESAYSNQQRNQALTFYKGKMRVIDDKGIFITDEVTMLPHNGYKTFNELKAALINALDSKDDALLKDFAAKIAPSEHILFYLKENPFTKQSLQNTDIDAVKEKYYYDLLKFKLTRWNQSSGLAYNRMSLTGVADYTIYRDGFVTNVRMTDPAFGDSRFMERLLRDALKINGYWISSYFMQQNFDRFQP